MLVDYSDSDSDKEVQASSLARETVLDAPKQKTRSLSTLLPRPKGRKNNDSNCADRDYPKKILVNIPKLNDEDLDQPPTKKARIGGAGVSGLSAILPAPKMSRVERTNAAAQSVPTSGLPNDEIKDANISEENAEVKGKQLVEKRLNTKINDTTFIPQLVARKPIQPMSEFRKRGGIATTASTGGMKVISVKPKVSLFGPVATIASNNNKPTVPRSVTAREYKPIMLEPIKPALKLADDVDAPEDSNIEEGACVENNNSLVTLTQQIDGLDAVAKEIGLDDAAMRHMYGRHGRQDQPIKFANFNVDEEYRQNELERNLGLAEEVKPVRAIQPGKHQLRSLLTAAQSQKGSLEESFAAGKRNRKEAGSKYGW